MLIADMPLALGEGTLILTDARRAELFRRQAPHATILTDAAPLAGMAGRFDAAILDGLLEGERWDRWLLQRVHGALRMGAPVRVVVPPLHSLASAFDLRFIAYAWRQVLRLLAQRAGLAPGLAPVVRRRYGFERLVDKLEGVGYTALESGPGWSWFSRRAVLSGRKGSTLSGSDGREWPDAAAHRRRHAQRYAAPLAAREAWLARHAEHRALVPRALEPAAWRKGRILVLAPHPDDELIGCGGTLCRLLAAGARVTVLQATDGGALESLHDLPAVRARSTRLDEAREVADALGARLVSWEEPDSQLACTPRTVARMEDLLRELRPTHVFTPFLVDPHPDHRALSRILAAALAGVGVVPRVLQYEVWSAVPANLYCEVTAQMRTLERLLLLYERAMRVEDFVHFCQSRNLALALELSGRPGYAEAFLSTSSAEYRRLAASA
jgi:LmbE family N-acetylglucosaminyl deacetylase